MTPGPNAGFLIALVCSVSMFALWLFAAVHIGRQLKDDLPKRQQFVRHPKPAGIRLSLTPMKLEEIQDGQVARVNGTVEQRGLVKAPFSGDECVCFELVVEQQHDIWHEVHRMYHGADFVVLTPKDERVIVDTSAFSVLLQAPARLSKRPAPTQAVLREFAATQNVELQKDARIRVREMCVRAGDLVSVSGNAVWEAADARAYRDRHQRQLRITAIKGGPVLIKAP